jgi:hypothetical protein
MAIGQHLLSPLAERLMRAWLRLAPRERDWFTNAIRRPPNHGWMNVMDRIPTPVPGVLGPAERGRGRGHHEQNLVHQLEARVRNGETDLTWEEWISLSPYLRPADEGDFTWNHNDRAGVNDNRYEAWLDVWFGQQGIDAAIELRRATLEWVEEQRRAEELRIEASDMEAAIEGPTNWTEAEVKSLVGMLFPIVKELHGRVWINSQHHLRIEGTSGLHWVLRPVAFALDGQRYRVNVMLEETSKGVCIQRHRASTETAGLDLLCSYVLALQTDLRSKDDIHTMGGAMVEGKRAQKKGIADRPRDDWVLLNPSDLLA